MSTPTAPVRKKTLGLTGVTVNAMALIAPGAFLWMTYQLQAANVDSSGASTAMDMWTGIVAALIVAFLTAFAFAELARRYPEAGTGSAYYFAEKAFLDREEPHHRRWARLAKFITGWAAHLFYWVYPGVMVAFLAVLVTYIVGQFGADHPHLGADRRRLGLFGAGRVHRRARHQRLDHGQHCDQRHPADRAGGLLSVLAILFRVQNPLGIAADEWYHPVASSIVLPHNFAGHAVPIHHRHPDPGRF